MWFLMEKTQRSYTLSERLLRAIQFTSDQGGEDLEELLDQGAAVNQPHGTLLPLHCACMANDARALRILLNRGAEVNAYDGSHRTALHHAVEQGIECMQVLLNYGANPELKDLNHDTPLHWAALRNNASGVRLLLEHGADINAVDLNNDTALSWAAMRGSLQSLQVLLEYNAYVDTVNFNGLSPIQRIALTVSTGLNVDKDDQCLKLLIRSSGQFNAANILRLMPNILLQESSLISYMLPYLDRPRKLVEQCRFVIRRTIGPCYLPAMVANLPIPERLKHYLLLDF